MKIYCVLVCVSSFLVQLVLCQEDGVFKPTEPFEEVSSGSDESKDGINNFFSAQREPKYINTDSPIQNINGFKSAVKVKPLNSIPPLQEDINKTEEYEKYRANVDTKTFPSSTQSSVSQTKGVDSDRSEETCTTVDKHPGSCVPFVECDSYLNLYDGLNTQESAINLFRKAYCGHDGPNKPKVCCPRVEPQTEKSRVSSTDLPANEGSHRKHISIYKEHFVPTLPEPPVCGVRKSSHGKIAGGVKAKLGENPWMAVLGYKDYEGAPIKWNCGGSLITSKHVLTACHCVLRHEDTLSVVRLGELDLSRDDDGADPIDVPVKHMLKHEDYVYGGGTNDVAVLVLDREIEFTDTIRPICLPIHPNLRSNSFTNDELMVAGWGRTSWKGRKAKHLQVVELPVISNDACKRYWKFIDESVICAGYGEGGKDSCEGDSGGPLVKSIFNVESYKKYYYEIGVVSFGKECARPGIPGVYMRVSHYLPWILSKVVGDTSLLN